MKQGDTTGCCRVSIKRAPQYNLNLFSAISSVLPTVIPTAWGWPEERESLVLRPAASSAATKRGFRHDSEQSGLLGGGT